MAKLVVFAAVVAAILAVSAAVGEAEGRVYSWRKPRYFSKCRREVQESPINACRQLIEQRLAGSFAETPGTRLRCCQQLQDVSLSCRCAAIRQMVYDYEEGMRQVEAGQEGSYGCAGPQILQPGQQAAKGYGEGAEGQQGEGHYGAGQEKAPCGAEGQQEQGPYGTGQERIPWRAEGQQGQGPYGTGQERIPWSAEGQQGQGPYGTGQERIPWSAGTGTRATSVQLRRVRQYSAQLPALCWMEPQYCRVFGGDEY